MAKNEKVKKNDILDLLLLIILVVFFLDSINIVNPLHSFNRISNSTVNELLYEY